MPPGTLTHWSLSPAYDALARDLERPLSRLGAGRDPWKDVEAEPPGLVAIYRYQPLPIRGSASRPTTRRGCSPSRG